ncbi:MAG TPA: IPT/TIG domain-containing protein, partial [Terriglobales bacterium]|nr:IPT/TIG domain-containing protein [Terriglobales bacterium]
MLQRPRTIAVFIVLVFLTAFVSTLSAQTFTLTSISPTHGYAGDQITLGGTNFGAVQGTGGLVNIGSAWATVVSWSDTQIVATVPYSGTGPVKVKQNGVFSNSIDFTFDAPILTSITPTHGFTGDQMTLVGSHFGATQGTVGLVWIGATWGTVVSWSDTQIVATVPYSGAGPVKVKQNGVFSNSIDFTFDTPTLTSISPTHGYAGDQITLVGSHFNPVAGTGGLVWLGAGWATVVSWSDTQIVATIPYQNAGPVKVKQYGVFSNSINFTFDAATLTSISPTHGYAGDQITLVGSHFGTVQGLVQIGPNWATVVSWSDSQIVVTAPFSSAGAVKIRQDNVWSNGINFTYDAPTLASVTPSSSAIGAQITLAGSHFGTQQSTSRVQLGSIVATVQSWADNQIVATVPSASSGTLAVFQNAVWSNGLSFTVLPNPSITSLTPSSGSVGTSVTITGANLGSSGTVSFNGVAASPSSWSSTSITVPVPNGATTGNVVVTASGLNTSGLLFTVPPPTPLLVQLNPTSGIPGTSVTITGSNFGSTQNNGQVLISAIPLTVTSWGDNTIIATIADEVDTGSPLPITVITGTGTSNQLQFTPTDPPITGVS